MLTPFVIGIRAGLGSLGKITLIVTPLLVFLEIIKDLNWLERLSKKVEPVLKPFAVSRKAAPALITGVFIGLIYGAGVLYQIKREGHLSPREMSILCLFLGLNHAVIEDVAILAVLGAKIWVLVLTRLLAAVTLTYLWGKWWSAKKDILPGKVEV